MKNRIPQFTAAAALTAASLSSPVYAEVAKLDNTGFLVTHIAEVEASPRDVWQRLMKPSDWWKAAHSWSGSTDGFYLEPRVGGCFCEKLNNSENGSIATSGAVEHMRVIHINTGKVLRMQGAIGPLQSEAVLGTFTAAIAPSKDDEGVSVVSFNYIVGGYMRFPVKDMAANVDAVIGAQFESLIKPFAPEEAKEGFELDLDTLSDDGDAVKPLPNPNPDEKGR